MTELPDPDREQGTLYRIVEVRSDELEELKSDPDEIGDPEPRNWHGDADTVGHHIHYHGSADTDIDHAAGGHFHDHTHPVHHGG